MVLEREQKEQVFKDFGLHSKDTGSAEVQIAMLTARINKLTEHCKKNHKDFSTKRGLLQMVNDRRSFLRYLANKDEEKYRSVIKRLGLRK